MKTHAGHRQRLRDRFLREGLDGFKEHEVLELMLFYCIPRVNTNEIAHELLDEFGSFAQVLEAPAEALQRVKGIGENASTFLAFAAALSRYYFSSKSEGEDKPLNTAHACWEVLRSRFKGQRNELVYLLCLDAKCKLLACRLIGEGSINSASVSIRKVVEVAMQTNASAVILAHNHPSGIAVPSGEDVQTTNRVAEALRAVDVILADHFIVSDNEYISMVQSNIYRPQM